MGRPDGPGRTGLRRYTTRGPVAAPGRDREGGGVTGDHDSRSASRTRAAGAPPRLDPAALTVAELARLLGVAELKVREHVADGAPAGPDGRINLVHYTAWLNRRLKERDGD